jgi:hypothetical protein
VRRRRVLRLPLRARRRRAGESLGDRPARARHLGQRPARRRGEGEEQLSGGAWAGALVVAVVFAIGLFFVVPVGLTSLIKHQLTPRRCSG